MLNIGYSQFVSIGKIMAIVSPEAAPIKRIVQDARDRGQLVDATKGRRTRSAIVCDGGFVVLSAIESETLTERLGK